MIEEKDLLTISAASKWATEYLKKRVTTSNISYLIQYGRITKYGDNGTTKISKQELITYYHLFLGKREGNWKAELGNDINWALSFDYLKESDTTKHVHRIHPYKGKFIPQLVQYFIDNHIDEFKKEIYFHPGDILLDPFCGSGTTLVQAHELGIHAIGIDISAFNALISNIKIEKHNLIDIQQQIHHITSALKSFISSSQISQFEAQLTEELTKFNNLYFPSPDFKYKIQRGLINQDKYGKECENKFLLRYFQLVNQYNIQLRQEKTETFLDTWYLYTVRQEIDLVCECVNRIQNSETKRVIQIILSRTIRSCRATTHSDLATLIEPITTTYYCAKHGKVCKPLFSILSWWERYSQDTIKRLAVFNKLRTETFQYCLTGDSQQIDILEVLQQKKPAFAHLVQKQKIQGIFSSPPYVGLIDYHEQHAYAYELFGFPRQDENEIGAMFRGQGQKARERYLQGIINVLNNCKKFLAPDYQVFLVANDKFNIYPRIAEQAGMQIVNQFKRPVMNRTEKDKAAYSENIFHLRAK